MSIYAEKPILILLHIQVPTDTANAFATWQAKLNKRLAIVPGFISLEHLSPTSVQKEWIIVQRFSNGRAAGNWQNSESCRDLMTELYAIASSVKITEKEESQLKSGITEILVTKVHPDKEKEYREWSAKVHQTEALFPGFRGVYLQSPQEGKGDHWITLLQFDTSENLDKWLGSTERQQLLHEASSFIGLETHRVISPYAGWFASIAKDGEIPPVWKQTMLVLLVLFPIVMLEMKYLSPLTAGLNTSLSTFIANALSVALISFPLLPIAIWLLGWWLLANSTKWNTLGTLFVLLLYIVEIAIFWHYF